MSDQDTTLQDAASLIHERRKYEGWLSALAARRDGTPPHVLDRVRADYQRRLDGVNERLAAHRGSLSDALSGLRSRLALIEAEEQLRRDERAEVELRAHVGELGESDVPAALQSIEESLARLGGERSELSADVDRVREFFDAAGGETAGDAGSVEGSARAEPPRPVESKTSMSQAAPAPAPSPSVPSVSATSQSSGPSVSSAPSAAAQSVRSRMSGAMPAPVTSAPDEGKAFDELSFLTSVIGEPAQPPTQPPKALPEVKPAKAPARSTTQASGISVRDEPKAPSLLAGLQGSGDSSNEAPLAANVTGNTPIKLRGSTQVEMPKTLKCGECGSLNRPTEWYCERCGAELAAL